MSAETDLLPLPRTLADWIAERCEDALDAGDVTDFVETYARANLAELQREVEGLRAEVEDGRRRHAATERDACQLASRLNASEKRAETVLAEAFEWRGMFTAEKARAERLAGALREARKMLAVVSNYFETEEPHPILQADVDEQIEAIDAALDQETTNG